MIYNLNQSKQGYLRLKDILAIIPVGRSTWWAKVKTGEYPQPIKISERITAWKVQDIDDLIEKINGAGNETK